MKKYLYILLGLSLLATPAYADWDDNIFDEDWDSEDRLYTRYACDSYGGIPEFQLRDYEREDRRDGRAGRGGRGGQGGFCFDNYDDETQIQACQLAQQAARAGAVFRMRPKAIHDGLTEGFDCGIEDGVNAGNTHYNYRRSYNDLDETLEDEVTKDLTGNMRRETKGPAENAGSATASNEVLSRFRKAVTAQGGELPSSTPGNPKVEYGGVQDGYSLNDRYVPSPDQILDEIYADEYLDLSAYYDSTYDREYSWGMERRRYGYGSERRRRGHHGYQGEDDGYNQVWMRIARSNGKPKRLRQVVRQWRQLSDQPIIVKVEETFQPPASEDGVLPPKQTRMVDVSLPSPRQVFSDRFQQVWRRTRHRVYYRIFERFLDQGYDMGFPAGERAGVIYASERGQRDAYNELFEEKSIKMYESFFEGAYLSAFASNYKTLKENPRIESYSWNLVGSDNDGALLQGESASFNFSLSNVGGKEKDFTVMAQELINGEARGSVGASENDYSVKALQKKTFSTEAFFVLPNDAISDSERKTQITVSLSAAGKSSAQVLTIFKPAGFENSNASADLRQATLYLPVTVYNPKNIDSVKPVKVRMYINGTMVEEKSFGMLPAGQQNLTFSMSQDFFEMIGQTYSFKVELDYGSETIQARENIVVSIDKKEALIEYFDHLVLNQNARLPNGVKWDDYLNTYLNEVTQVYKDELQSLVDQYKLADDSKDRREIKKREKPKFEFDRRDNLESSRASIILRLYKKRPYNDSSRDLKKKQKSHVKDALAKLAGKAWAGILRADQQFGDNRGDARHQRDYFGNTICASAQVLYAFQNNKRRQDAEVIKIEAKLGGDKLKFECNVD